MVVSTAVVLESAPMDLVPDEFGIAWRRLEGRYDIEHVVAAGGFGLVYFGRHCALKSPVALKVLRIPEGISEAEQQEVSKRFLEEAQMVAALQHPSIVRVLDFGSSHMPNGGIAPWAVFEWVEGETLGDFLAARPDQPMRPREIISLLKPVFEGLAAAHALGIVHRDVKPANIMLPRAGTSAMSSRILDFGIAKAMQHDESHVTSGSTQTRSKTANFSLKYASPEQLGGVRTGPWTDVHALALVVTRALTAREPFSGESFIEIATRVVHPRRPTPAALGVDAGAWEPVLARAMAIKTSQRYRDVPDFLRALEAALPPEVPQTHGEFSSAAGPPSGLASPSGGRHNAKVLGAILALVLLLALAMALWLHAMTR